MPGYRPVLDLLLAGDLGDELSETLLGEGLQVVQVACGGVEYLPAEQLTARHRVGRRTPGVDRAHRLAAEPPLFKREDERLTRGRRAVNSNDDFHGCTISCWS